MARTFVRQSQISGSFSSDDSLNYAARETAFSASSNLQADLNILRSVVKENFGTAYYIDSVTPYNLTALGEKVDDIMQVEAAFTGMVSMPNLSVTGTGSFGGDISAVSGSFTGDLDAVNAVLSGDLDAVNAVLSGDLDAVNGTFTGDLGAVNATLSGDLSAVSGSFTGDLDAVNAVLSGDLDAVNATLSGDLSAVSGSFSGDISAIDANLSGDLNAVNATLSGDLGAVSGSFSGDLVVAGNFTVNGTQTIVNSTIVEIADLALLVASGSDDTAINAGGGAGIIVESADGNKSILWQNGDWNISDDLDVTGDITASGDLSAASGSFSGDLDVTGLSDLGNVEAVEIKIDGDVAQRLYIVGASGEIKDEGKLLFDGSNMLVDGGMKLTGSLEAVNGDFSGEVSALTAELANLSISSNSITADGFLTLADASGSIQLTDGANAALSGTLNGSVSIYDAFNRIDNSLSALGAGHQKDVIAINSTVTAVTSSLDLGNGLIIADDLNVYVNGVLIHASGSAASEAGVIGVDAAKKNGENVILFAFELRNGDVVTLEKF